MSSPPFLRSYTVCMLGILALAILSETGLVNPDLLAWPMAILNASFMILALAAVRGYVLKATLLCCAAAITITVIWQIPLRTVIETFNRSASIIAFITVVPIVIIPIREGGYMGAMSAFLANSTPGSAPNSTPGSTPGSAPGSAPGSVKGSAPGSIKGIGQAISSFMMLAGLHLLMSMVLNIGSIPIMQRLLDKAALPKRYLSLVYATGYSAYIVLSPFDGIVNALILAAGTSYAGYAGHGLTMAAAIMASACLLMIVRTISGRHQHGQPEQPVHGVTTDAATADSTWPAAVADLPAAAVSPPAAVADLPAAAADLPAAVADLPSPGRKILDLSLHILAMTICAVLFGRFIQLRNPAMGTAAVILVYTAIWIRLLGIPWAAVRQNGREYAMTLASYRAFLPFLVSAAFLGAMAAWTPLKATIALVLASVDILPRYVAIQAIILGTAFLGLLGVHMMITVSAIAGALDPAALDLSAPAFAQLLLTCWFVTMNVASIAPFTTIVGEAIGEKPVVVALRYNLPLALMMLVLAPAIIR